jgi:hypothetical protein
MNTIRQPFDHIKQATKPFYVASLDLGCKQDYTALALARIVPSPESTMELNKDRINVIGLRRYPLKTPYPQIVAKVAETINHPNLHFDMTSGYLTQPTLLIDATGVGAPTVDQFLQTPMNATMVPVTITSGREAHEGLWNNTSTASWNVPKIDLVSSVMAALEDSPQRLQIAGDLPDSHILMAELLNFRSTLTASGNQTFGAGSVGREGNREGAHDDLLLATAMLVWWVARRKEDRRIRYGPNPMAGYRG